MVGGPPGVLALPERDAELLFTLHQMLKVCLAYLHWLSISGRSGIGGQSGPGGPRSTSESRKVSVSCFKVPEIRVSGAEHTFDQCP